MAEHTHRPSGFHRPRSFGRWPQEMDRIPVAVAFEVHPLGLDLIRGAYARETAIGHGLSGVPISEDPTLGLNDLRIRMSDGTERIAQLVEGDTTPEEDEHE